MSLPAALERRLTDRVTVTVLGTPTFNSRGDPRATGTSTTYKARLEPIVHMVTGPDGRNLQAQGRAYVGPSTAGADPAFSVRDQMVNAATGAIIKMLAVDTLTGRDGTHHLVVHFG